MSERWTPGPWRLGNDATGKALTIWGAQSGICVTSVFDDRMGNDTPPMRQAIANARLIAAAPDLFDALAAVLCAGEGKSVMGTICEMERAIAGARAALAKARGKQ